MTYHVVGLGRVTLDVGPREDRDSDTERGAPRLGVKVRNVGEIHGTGILDGLSAPRSVESSDFVARLRGFRDRNNLLTSKTDGVCTPI